MKSQHTIVVSLNGALTRLEVYQGEIFVDEEYDILGLSSQEFAQHDKKWHHEFKVVVVAFTYYHYLDLDLSMFDLIILIDEESLDTDSKRYLDNLANKFQNSNIIAIASGHHLQYPMDANRIYLFPFFFANICKYNSVHHYDALQSADRQFDALLGMMKPHRDFVFYQLAKHDLLPCSLVNYTTNQHRDGMVRTIYRSPQLNRLEPPGVLQSLPDFHLNSYLHVNNDRGPRISHVIPWAIYESCLYSIVTETNWQHHTFFSEKTAKCFYAHRPFVFFGAQHQLHTLRLWGFITFDNVIDESYDSIVDDIHRWTSAFDQVLWLSRQNPKTVYSAVRRALQHNHQHLQNRQYFVEPLRDWLLPIAKFIDR